MRVPEGRADTPEKKRAVVEAILAAWNKAPEQRLGQMLANALGRGSVERDLLLTEDNALVEVVTKMVEGWSK